MMSPTDRHPDATNTPQRTTSLNQASLCGSIPDTSRRGDARTAHCAARGGSATAHGSRVPMSVHAGPKPAALWAATLNR
jgi:hypothetical protein